MDASEKPDKRVRFIIESSLKNVPLIGMSINRLCSQIPFLERDAYYIELCVVEAVNNCIIHAYGNQKEHEVEAVLSFFPDRVVLKILDAGAPINEEIFRQEAFSSFELDPSDIQDIPEGGRGIGIIKSIMDDVSYERKHGKNCLTMVKKIPPGTSLTR